MKRNNIFKLIFTAAALAVMVCIFVLSAQPAEVSSETSEGFIATLVKLFVKNFGGMSPEKQQALIDSLQFAVRKLAHFSIYGACGFFIAGSMAFHTGMKFPVKYGLALLIGMVYAASDEFHQHFVPGRSCELRDMCIDWSGVLLGILLQVLLFYLTVHILRRKRDVKKR